MFRTAPHIYLRNKVTRNLKKFTLIEHCIQERRSQFLIFNLEHGTYCNVIPNPLLLHNVFHKGVFLRLFR